MDVEVRLKSCCSCCGSGSDVYTGNDCLDCAGTGFVPFGVHHGNEISAEKYIELVRDQLYNMVE